VRSIWDLYLDADDAAVVLHALAVVERHRAVREPLPLEDADRLLDRLGTIARIAAEEAVHWQREAADRHEEAEVDGGRWGSVAAAARMRDVAADLADGSREIADAADAAVRDLQARLTDAPPDDAGAAAEAVVLEAQRLLRRYDEGTG
jgi:hypothetical protein